MDKNRIKQMIRNGEGTEFYEDWAKYEDSSVRYTLAETGYAPHIFINDWHPSIREQAMRKNPKYLPQLLGKPENLIIVNEYLEKQAKIPVDVLEQHIQDMKNDENGYYMDDMEAKLKALKYKPSPIETTMTPLQLYKTNSPLWALQFSPHTIYQIQSIERTHSKEDATPLLDPTLSEDEVHNIYWKIGKDD